VTWVINPAVGCHYFPPGPQLPPQPLRGLLPICCLVNRGTMDVNSLPKTVTRHRRGCDLNPGPAAPESSTLTTRLPSHPFFSGSTKSKHVQICRWCELRCAVWCAVWKAPYRRCPLTTLHIWCGSVAAECSLRVTGINKSSQRLVSGCFTRLHCHLTDHLYAVVKLLSMRWWIPIGAMLEGPKLESEGPRAEVEFPTADQGFSSTQGTLFSFYGI